MGAFLLNLLKLPKNTMVFIVAQICSSANYVKPNYCYVFSLSNASILQKSTAKLKGSLVLLPFKGWNLKRETYWINSTYWTLNSIWDDLWPQIYVIQTWRSRNVIQCQKHTTLLDQHRPYGKFYAFSMSAIF